MDSKNSITLNEVYKRLSKSAQLQCPAPFQTVENIYEHVKIAEKLYLAEDGYHNYEKYQDLNEKYVTFAK